MRKGLFYAVVCLVGVLWLAVAVASGAQPTPANDDFAQARPIVPPLFPPNEYVFVESEGATTEPGEPAAQGIPGGASLWYAWTPETTGDTNISACGETGPGVVGIYVGEAVAALEPVPRLLGSRPCEFGFKAVAGVTYRVQVEGSLDPATGTPTTVDSELALSRFLLNDDFEAATDLGDSPNTGASSEWGNLGATKQPGEPDHDGDPGGSSVWYVWTAPASGIVKVDACLATFPARLAVYTGFDLAALTPIAAGAGEPGAGCNSSVYGPGQIFFQAVAGTRYDIAVDGRGGASGTFNLIVVMDYETQRRLRGEFLPGPTAPPGSPPPSRPEARRVSPIILSRNVDSATRTAVFRLGPSVHTATFRCRLDHHAYRPCGATVTYRHLAYGRHAFHARTTAASSRPAATATFEIARPSRR